MNLYPNEEIDFESRETDKNYLSKDELNEKYIRGEVRIVTEQARYPLNNICKMLEKPEEYKRDPDYQRRHRWDNTKRSRLIESFIMNVPVPPIFLYEYDYSQYEVMDGLQRLTTIDLFYKNEFKLENLEEWVDLNGLCYSELPEQVQKGIDRRYLSSIILLKETARRPEEAQKMKQLVFERINSGGVKLEHQETRNALYDGPLNRLCIKLSRNLYFCRMWNIPEQNENEIRSGIPSDELIQNEVYKKMDDVELVLRFFAFRQLDKKNLSHKDFLDCFLQNGNLFPPTLLNEYESLFNSTIRLVYDVLGETAFWTYRPRKDKWIWFERATKTAYDPFMYVFSENLHNHTILLDKKEEIQKSREAFYQEKIEFFDGKRNNRSDVLTRIDLVRNFLNRFIEN